MSGQTRTAPYCCHIGCDESAEYEIITVRRSDPNPVRAVLEEIAKGEGPFNRDPLEHASNTIDAMKALASEALARPGFGFDRIAGPDIYSDDTHACTGHVGDLLGWQPVVRNPEEIYWHVRPL